MKSILGEILMGEVKVLAEADPEKMAEECADKIMGALGSRTDTDEENASGSCAEDVVEKGEYEILVNPVVNVKDTSAFRLSIEHTAGNADASIFIVGKGVDVFNGIANLLEKTALILAGGETTGAAIIAGKIGEMVKEEILSGGISNEKD